MADKICAGPVENTTLGGSTAIKEAVCIHTNKIMDACKDKDCIADLRVFFTAECQELVNSATTIRARSAELLYVYIDVESIPFNRGFFTVDVQFFYRITVEVFAGTTRPATCCGLAVFNKRVLLFGSEGSAKIFSSKTNLGEMDCQNMMRANLPQAYVEAVEPILLDAKLVDNCSANSNNCNCGCNCGCSCNCGCNCNCGCSNSDSSGSITDLPNCVCCCFEDTLVDACDGKRVLVTLGQFSIIRLERETQLLIPSYDYCIPNKECTALSGNEAGDPCEIFNSLSFPTESFFPPAECDINDCGTSVAGTNNCGCGR